MKGKTKRTLRVGITALAVCLLWVGWLYGSLVPDKHFQQQRLPLLAAAGDTQAARGSGSAAIGIASVQTEPEEGGNERCFGAGESGMVSAHRAELGLEAGMGAGDDGTRQQRIEEQPGEAPTGRGAKAAGEAAAAEQSGFQVLLLGLDGDGDTGVRTDVMIVARLVPAKGKVELVSIPRDTRVELANVGRTKINHAYPHGERSGEGQGVLAAAGAASRLLGLPIHYYMSVDFQGFARMIDFIGGVEVTLAQDMVVGASRQPLQAGKQRMDGKLALAFARERQSLLGGDFDRQADQAALLRAVATEMAAPEQWKRLPSLLAAGAEHVRTNLKPADMASLALMLKGIDSEHIRHHTLPGKALTAYDPLVGKPLWYWEPDRTGTEALIRQLLRDDP